MKNMEMLLNEARRVVEVIAEFGRSCNLDMMQEVNAAREKLAGIEETLEAFGYRLGWKDDELAIVNL